MGGQRPPGHPVPSSPAPGTPAPQLPEKQAEVRVARDCGVGTGSGLIHESEQLETVEGL